jgi:hypothetical protein
MSKDEARALGLRALECDGFRWMPGMLAQVDWTLGGRSSRRVTARCAADMSEGENPWHPWSFVACWPDFRDPATLGCLVALVREAWGECSFVRRRAHKPSADWAVFADGEIIAVASTEAGALVAALGAANGE